MRDDSSNRHALEDDEYDKASESERSENEGEEEERRKQRTRTLVRDKLITVEVKEQPTYKTFVEYSFVNLQVAHRNVLDSTSSIPIFFILIE